MHLSLAKNVWPVLIRSLLSGIFTNEGTKYPLKVTVTELISLGVPDGPVQSSTHCPGSVEARIVLLVLEGRRLRTQHF